MDFEKSYDVIVAGAGIAGIAAAVQAAREGKKTVLIEKTIIPGGLATAGLVYVYLPLCDGEGHQVSFGITEELLKLSIQYGPGDIPDFWAKVPDANEKERYQVIFSPAAYVLALDEYLVQNGVDVWYDTLICDTQVENNKITGVYVENESGRGLLKAKCVVDASGTAILARRAGIPCHTAPNFLSIWDIEYKKSQEQSRLGAPVVMHPYGVPWDVTKAPEGTVFYGIDGATVTDFVLKSRKMLLDEMKSCYAAGADRKDYYSLKVPLMPQFRKIFSIDAKYVLRDTDSATRFEDSIGLAADWRRCGSVWEIPYSSMIPDSPIGGYIAAGRCTGAETDAWEVTRVIPVAGLTGQVAGLAAAMSIDAGVDPADLDVSALQAKLRTLGFPLHMPEVGLAYK